MLVAEENKSEFEKKIVVRILSGLLRGCEFTLRQGNTLFLVVDDNTISGQHKGTLLPDNTIYIPSEQAGVSFEIMVTHKEACEVFLREVDTNGALGRSIAHNEVVLVGELEFAWRHEHDVFSDEVLRGKTVEKGAAPPQAGVDSLPVAKGRWYKALAAIAMIGAISIAGYGYLTGTQRQISSISTLLSFATDDYHILYGRDSGIYVFANSDKSADWAIQTLIRQPVRQQVSVVSIAVEEERIARWIETQWPYIRFHQVRLADPQRPVIRISPQRTQLTEQQRSQFITAIKHAFPYTEEVILENLDDKTVREVAEQGLKKMALSFREINNGDSVTFVILGVIEDGMLESIKAFVNQYYQQWSGQYVHFSVELKTDWFRDKSFKFGEQGYIKLGAGHWFFPHNPTKE